MAKRKNIRTGRFLSAAERTRTRRVVVVMAVTLAVLTAGFFAAWLLRSRSVPDEGHAHQTAAHGGVVVPLGEGEHHRHAEAVLEKGGVLTLYTLGDDAAKVEEVDSQVLTAAIRPEGSQEAVSVVLLPFPQDGDADEKTSRFLGKLPEALWGKPLTVAFPDVAVGGERFRLEFALEGGSGGEKALARAGEEDEALYRTPGGKYTEGDIRTNGDATAVRKFQGFHAAHDFHPKTGDAVCPVTRAKANAACTWIVGGRTYEFCCPPCVEQFLKTAKQRPDRVKEPGDYVKQK